LNNWLELRLLITILDSIEHNSQELDQRKRAGARLELGSSASFGLNVSHSNLLIITGYKLNSHKSYECTCALDQDDEVWVCVTCSWLELAMKAKLDKNPEKQQAHKPNALLLSLQRHYHESVLECSNG
jgi:hypothetical protein